MRGTHIRLREFVRTLGIIPAYAGNTNGKHAPQKHSLDHPRVCGEHPMLLAIVLVLPGSSPRMRGTRGSATVRLLWSGIIPAYAGNTLFRIKETAITQDHPRVCGEHSTDPWGISEATGSSPRMRGTHHFRSGVSWQRGIIPAYAGNTEPTRRHRERAGDHPRVCGEHTLTQQGIDMDKGSSPRMRGTRLHRRYRHRAPGIIPAYAGNTHRRRVRLLEVRDHPRVCGEHRDAVALMDEGAGSSPRMRGTPPPAACRRSRPGIIPAYAGNTAQRGL